MSCPDRLTFAAPEGVLTFDSPASVTFEVDRERRTIRGLAVPYGVPGRSLGKWWRFAQGSLRWNADAIGRVKLLLGHDFDQCVGYLTELDDRPDGLYFAARVSPGADGDRALDLATPDPDTGSAAWDGISIGLGQHLRSVLRRGIHDVSEADLGEVSLTPMPSFTDARVHSVAASAAHHHPERNTMTAAQRRRLALLRGKANRTEAEEVEFSDLTDLALTFAAEAGTEGVTFDADALAAAVTEAVTAGFSAAVPAGGRQTLDPTAGNELEVTEAPLYRFDGIPAQRGFVSDIIAANNGDSEARQMLAEHVAEFAVTSANTGSLNPTKNRPDLYVPNLPYTRPLWDAVTTGSIEDKTAFTIPKFASATGLVSPHVEGLEPTPGTFAATDLTVTPGAISGKIEVNREVIDAGGSPQADQIIWGEMLNAYYEAEEVRIATLLAAVSTPELNLGGAEDGALVDALKSYFVGLQFVRGGNRFSRFVADGNLFPALTEAKDGAGRPLLPVMGPTNTDGQTSGGFDTVNLGSQAIRAAWALGTGNDKRSYSLVPTSVYAWMTAPRQFRFEYQVKSVDIGIWGYAAEAVTRESDVKPIDYTTLDA